MDDFCITDFYEREEQALRSKEIVLRDSLGALAVQILNSKYDLSKMPYHDMMVKLYEIIGELHSEYHQCNGNFSV